MRIIAGKNKSRKLLIFDSDQLRPTTDKNREALFNILQNSPQIKEIGFDLQKANILDVFCGSAAVALEALSRGAKFAAAIDKDAKHIDLAKENAKNLKEENINFILSDATASFLPESDIKYDLIFLDPPYHSNLIEAAIDNLIEKKYIHQQSLVVLELQKNEKIDCCSLQLVFEKTYGKTMFKFLIRK